MHFAEAAGTYIVQLLCNHLYHRQYRLLLQNDNNVNAVPRNTGYG